ncbi:MAG: hypothetical protein A2736_00725 [Candidatus Yanofskybacteria bacterium RIFCSPHIGHO2_01_FULL_41_27]|uniref:MBL fold metallo-hydrolase n=3 Tax=Candidatus Yanofskyibacteriota TaxID=1752733 RepID=A0A1F8HTU2_9BACT|nr:MAG: Beta-lactamase domain protein [Candidatus Yanofskybacteria bacterium GW2011_GWC2_41_9]OGN00286.1 MAG: hypothetical protein A2736_00725 [Candidatus Yanofskybacteria bacterium RIFCSPHIGHO2_01_FULL_41_27]OGN10405.1 MAG: hypothetical protein A3C64_02670 [Candidatus Yanofskybacteria bacterium RIFCSPHIGHO2_02_FULL_41_12]OGN19905.1 MAG: hypothetical protein A3B00_00150 [Candidatus Yanofskybacteria bacterium RIFCSPLOWO2_01_FULL_41_33]OGN41001.1 MAG: hypothetical protein A2606_03465 [Candidatus 
MPNKISIVAGGGANFISRSFYALTCGETTIGIDYGGNVRGDEEQEPDFSVAPDLEYMFYSHAHRDHVFNWPRVSQRFPKLKAQFATHETKLLAVAPLRQAIRRAERKGIKPLFAEEEVNSAYNSTQEISMEKPIFLPEGITVYPISASHILGSVSYLIEYRGEWVFITNDICYQDRSLIKGAFKISVSGRLRLLVRESTCINEIKKEREDTKNDLVSATKKALANGEQVLFATLSIDRAQDVYMILKNAGIEPVIDGSERAFDVYRKYFKGSVLDEAHIIGGNPKIRNIERENIRRRGKPAVIIAPAGMLLPDSPSSWWAERFLGDERKHIFVVCYQDPTTQGFQLLNSEVGDFLPFNAGLIKRKCEVGYFDLSAHMDKKDGEELEERMNPDTVFLVHGDDKEIDSYISEHQSDGRRRIKALVGQEVEA